MYKEEGEEWEYASYRHGAGATNEAGHNEEGLLFQSLGEGTSTGDEEEPNKQGSRRDVMGGCPSTHDPCWKQIEQEAHRRQHEPGVTKDLLKCASGAVGYGVIGKLVDAVKLSPEGFVASCAWAVLFG